MGTSAAAWAAIGMDLAPRSVRAASSGAPADAVALVAAPRQDAPGQLSYDGSAAGPVLRLKKGDALWVSLNNKLTQPTSLQWHGLRCPNEVGSPLEAADALAPGSTLSQTFTPPDSGVFWFHPAALPGLPDGTALGLRGVLIVEEAAPPLVDRDFLMVVSDGLDPTSLLVNGSASPLTETLVTGGRLRLRLVNASTTRILVLGIEGAHPKVVAIDGQPSDLFAPVRDSVPVGPGARFELMLDAPRTEGAAIRVLSRALAHGEGADALLATLTTAGAARDPLPQIAALPPNPLLPPAIPLEDSVRATLLITAVADAAPGVAHWRVNETASLLLPPSPLFKVSRGHPVTLAFENRTQGPIPLRLHGHVMRLLHAKDDGWEPYWRDSVILPPVAVAHVAFVADNPGRWLIESAVFAQAASGLRHWFEVA